MFAPDMVLGTLQQGYAHSNIISIDIYKKSTKSAAGGNPDILCVMIMQALSDLSACGRVCVKHTACLLCLCYTEVEVEASPCYHF